MLQIHQQIFSNVGSGSECMTWHQGNLGEHSCFLRSTHSLVQCPLQQEGHSPLHASRSPFSKWMLEPPRDRIAVAAVISLVLLLETHWHEAAQQPKRKTGLITFPFLPLVIGILLMIMWEMQHFKRKDNLMFLTNISISNCQSNTNSL